MSGCARCALLLCAAVAYGADVDYRRSPGYEAYERANAHFSARKLPESLASVDQALSLDPKLLPALTLKARLAMAARDHTASRTALIKAVEVAPTSWYAHFLLGFQYYLENDLKAALTALEKARQLNPKESQPALYLGLTNESFGNIEAAIDYYSQAVAIEEASRSLQAETLLTFARLLLLLDRLDECAKLLDRAVRIEPNLRDVHYERSRLFMKKGDAASAATAGEKALSLPAAGIPDRQVRYVLVRAYGLLGNEKRAAEHAAALRTQDPP
jgi:tetratricopeptide (TPR) repeat protein